MAGQNIHTNFLWGIVLAAGEGNRISNFIQKFYGLNSPKQYIAFTGKRSMLQHTIQRAERLILPERTLVVVNPKHMGEIKRQLSGRPRDTVIFQPYNRETAPGVLCPLSTSLRGTLRPVLPYFHLTILSWKKIGLCAT